ncbi:hypothetical protein TorRG33x02_173050 [Trema orientale]|uniref:Uncharacterized protein n=1 Tax=Trema orientale TaxID=63057 RepID=A0A2P5EMW9_TREOI|nr:hypothetical protein TorRG33x02_173050 [Trema orientale]
MGKSRLLRKSIEKKKIDIGLWCYTRNATMLCQHLVKYRGPADSVNKDYGLLTRIIAP